MMADLQFIDYAWNQQNKLFMRVCDQNSKWNMKVI